MGVEISGITGLMIVLGFPSIIFFQIIITILLIKIKDKM